MRRPSARAIRRILNLWPPFLFAGIRVLEISDDWRHARVVLKRHWYNRNFVGTHFGGSLFAMTDPFWMIMTLYRLGDGYIVWDKSAEIEFVEATESAGLRRVRARRFGDRRDPRRDCGRREIPALVRDRSPHGRRPNGRARPQASLRTPQARGLISARVRNGRPIAYIRSGKAWGCGRAHPHMRCPQPLGYGVFRYDADVLGSPGRAAAL